MFRRKMKQQPQESVNVVTSDGRIITPEMKRCTHMPLVNGKAIDTVVVLQANGNYVCSRCGRAFTEDEKNWLETEHQLKSLLMDFASA